MNYTDQDIFVVEVEGQFHVVPGSKVSKLNFVQAQCVFGLIERISKSILEHNQDL